MLKKRLILAAICFLTAFPALPGYSLTIRGKSNDYNDLSSDRKKELQEDVQLAKAAYKDEKIPPGYRAATRAEFNQYVGLTSTKRLKYDQSSGYFYSVGGTKWYQSLLIMGINDGNGLGGRLLINENDGSIVLSFRGTEGSVNDVNTDILQYFGSEPEQYREAAEMLNNLVANTEKTQQNIKVVGHSLGGGEAAYATMNCVDLSRVTTTTFNAAGIHGINLGNTQNASKVITNVRADMDVVSQAGFLVGNTYVIDSDRLFDRERGGLETALRTVSPGLDRAMTARDGMKRIISTHSISTLEMLMRDDSSSPQQSSSDDAEVVSFTDNSSPNGDLVSKPGNTDEADSGGVCRPGDTSPDGDMVAYNGERDPSHGGGMCRIPDNEPVSGDSVSGPETGMYASGDATIGFADDADLMNMIQTLALSNYSAGSVLPNITGDFPVVLPNLGYKRVLWLLSGDDPEIQDLFGVAINGIREISSVLRSGINKFGKDD